MKLRKIFVLAYMGISLVCVARVPDVFEVKEFTLSNGLSVWVNEDHSLPKVYGAVVVRAGARDCPNTGIAHYFEHMLFKGTDKIGTVDYASEKQWLDSIAMKYDQLAQTTDEAIRMEIQLDINRLSVKAGEYAIPNEFSNLISRYGGTELNAYTSLDETVFYNTFSPQYIAQWAELNSERLLNPVFRMFQSELETVYEEKNMYSDNMLMPAVEAIQKRVFEGTPYQYSIIGSTESLKNPRLSEMRAFFDKYYVAANMGLILCGDLCADSIMPLMERTFGRIRRGEAPERTRVDFCSFAKDERMDVKIPLPLIKMQGYVYRVPGADHPDAIPLELAMSLLSNDSGTGLLDSLEHENRVMGVMAGLLDMVDDGTLVGYGYVPRLPFGSKKKAGRLCAEQVERLKDGRFDEEVLEALKAEELRECESDLENIDLRAAMMVQACSRGKQWKELLTRQERIRTVTSEDIARVSRKYLGDNRLQLTKRFGRYPKDKVSQPGYEAVTPQNAGAKSDYARRMEQMPVADVAPRFVDFDKDVHTSALAPLVTLYAVGNPVNELFRLQLVYHYGTVADPRLSAVASYITELGTDSLTRRQLGYAFQRLGTQLEVDVDEGRFTITLCGFDSAFVPSMELLGHFMATVKADEAEFRNLVSMEKIGEKAFLRENATIAQAIYDKVAYGERSAYLNRSTVAELKKMDGRQLVDLFHEVQGHELSIIYSGTLGGDEVGKVVCRYVPLDSVTHPRSDAYRPLMAYAEPTVYVYDNPTARQTIVGTYQQLPPQSDAVARARLSLWGEYFGGGMSSLLFQDIREFRSLAYYAYGGVEAPSLVRHPDASVAYQTVLGTQSDKAMQALDVLDTLLTSMPVRENNMVAVKQAMVNRMNNNYPTFRDVGRKVALWRAGGYEEDPGRHAYAALSEMGVSDVTGFYDNCVKTATRVTVVVGDKRKLDMQALGKYGKVIELKLEDFYKK